MPLERLPILTFEGIAIDQDAYEVFVDGEAVPMQPRDFQILCELAKRPRQVISQSDLAALTYTAPNSIIEHIRHIRGVVGEKAIATIRGVGYRWDLRPVGGTPT